MACNIHLVFQWGLGDRIGHAEKRPIKKFNKHCDDPRGAGVFFFSFPPFLPSNFPRSTSPCDRRRRTIRSFALALFFATTLPMYIVYIYIYIGKYCVAVVATTAVADDTSGIRHTRKRQNYTLNIYDKPNPLSTLKTHQPFLSVYTIKTRSQRDARYRRGDGAVVIYSCIYIYIYLYKSKSHSCRRHCLRLPMP
jgi:hypothetical protein